MWSEAAGELSLPITQASYQQTQVFSPKKLFSMSNFMSEFLIYCAQENLFLEHMEIC
jgi:hypothetical protein